MRYLTSVLRIFVLVAVVLAVFSFQDIKKVKATPTGCTGEGPIFDCTVTSGDSIPASYEWQNVIIDGPSITVNADAVKVITGTNTECSNPVNSNCDSKRHFNSLTIKNGATLTHRGLTLDKETCDSGPPSPGQTGCLYTRVINDGHIVKTPGDINPATREENPGMRWKKVDIEIVGDLILESGGKINVDGKGYPNDYGTGHGSVGMCPDGKGCAGGGGYGGEGGGGNTGIGTLDIGGKTYGSEPEPSDFGSGAGLSNCSDFGALGSDKKYGGGIIKISAGSITISDVSSMITANGNNDSDNCEFSPGGPSGGSIWLISQTTITTPGASFIVDTSCRDNTKILNFAKADKGYYCDTTTRGTDGSIGTLMINGESRNDGRSNEPGFDDITNIFAKGGDVYRNGGAGGGGRIVLGTAGSPPSPCDNDGICEPPSETTTTCPNDCPSPGSSIQSKTIEVTVKWKDTPSSLQKTVKLYNVLRSVVITTP